MCLVRLSPYGKHDTVCYVNFCDLAGVQSNLVLSFFYINKASDLFSTSGTNESDPCEINYDK